MKQKCEPVQYTPQRQGRKTPLNQSRKPILLGRTPPPMKINLTGYDLLIHPRLNKGTAFTDSERDAFGLHGLLPPHVGTLEDQRKRRKKGLDEVDTSLQKYSFMRDLQDTNETLFYSLITHLH